MSQALRQPLDVRLHIIVLAAGEGTRMNSAALPKVLHSFAGRSLLGHVLAATEPLGATATTVVVGHRRDEVIAHLAAIAPDMQAVVQDVQLGTAHAVQVALDGARERGAGTKGAADNLVLVVPGDAPLLRAETLAALIALHRDGSAAATLLTSLVADPTGYGRVIRGHGGGVDRIVEHNDATDAELEVDEVSALVYLFDAPLLTKYLPLVGSDNSQGEYYLPDVIGLLRADERPVLALLAPAAETAGVNDRVQLAHAHRVYNDRLLAAHMRHGVTVIDPATTWVDASVHLDADVTIKPNVQLEGSCRIGSGAVIGPDCTLTDTTVGSASVLQRVVANRAQVGAGVTIGPYAYLRPGTVLGDDVHVGTYVEIKASDVGVGTKIPHLSYVGDASIGEHSNIGAATVFVNYDGVHKHRSRIGDHARTGADNMFVAPVTVGDGAYTAAGSIITHDVPPGALGVGRVPQRNILGWVQRKRAGTDSAAAASAASAAHTVSTTSTASTAQAFDETPPEPAHPNRETETPER